MPSSTASSAKTSPVVGDSLKNSKARSFSVPIENRKLVQLAWALTPMLLRGKGPESNPLNPPNCCIVLVIVLVRVSPSCSANTSGDQETFQSFLRLFYSIAQLCVRASLSLRSPFPGSCWRLRLFLLQEKKIRIGTENEWPWDGPTQREAAWQSTNERTNEPVNSTSDTADKKVKQRLCVKMIYFVIWAAKRFLDALFRNCTLTQKL